MRIPLKAWLYRGSFNLRKIQSCLGYGYLCGDTLLLKLGEAHHVCLTNFGGIVFWPFEETISRDLLKLLEPDLALSHLVEGLEDRLVVETEKETQEVFFNEIWLGKKASDDHICMISQLLAQSVALEDLENHVGQNLERFTIYLQQLRGDGKIRLSSRNILKSIGFAMETRYAVINNLALLDKPEVTWESEELEKLFQQLYDFFELPERQRSMERKLDFLADNTSLLSDFLTTRKSLRLEWAIVLLIVLEIVILVFYELLR